jgi:hypothetical protein
MASEAEAEMREKVEARIAELLPNARIIHELEVGRRRADLAAITQDRVILFELKSSRDTLDRLEGQMREFFISAHVAVAVIDEVHFDTSPYVNGAPRFVGPKVPSGAQVWAYPEGDRGTYTDSIYRWTIQETEIWQPAPRSLLGLLMAGEEREILRRHGLPIDRRQAGNSYDRCGLIAYHLTGREIGLEVCRALRARWIGGRKSTPPIEAEAAMGDETAGIEGARARGCERRSRKGSE